jgi:G:T-mismatch repair DNA endonuclease (very short patch repair protein)
MRQSAAMPRFSRSERLTLGALLLISAVVEDVFFAGCFVWAHAAAAHSTAPPAARASFIAKLPPNMRDVQSAWSAVSPSAMQHEQA